MRMSSDRSGDASSTPLLLALLVSIFDSAHAPSGLPASRLEIYEMAARTSCC